MSVARPPITFFEESAFLQLPFSEYVYAPMASLTNCLLAIVLAVFIHFLRWFVCEKLSLPLQYALRLEKKDIIRKYQENWWYVWYFTINLAWAIAINYGEPWFFMRPEEYFNGFPDSIKTDFARNPQLGIYYLVQASFYIQAVFQVAVLERSRKDWLETFVHHTVTLILIALSWHAGWVRPGMVILYLHFTSDILLYVAKILHYGQLEEERRLREANPGQDSYVNATTKFYERTKNVSFFLFAGSFFYSRNFCVPYYIVIPLAKKEFAGASGAFHYLFKYQPDSKYILTFWENFCIGPYCISSYWLSYALMIVLTSLHYYWAFLIGKMVIRALQDNTVVDDIRYEEKKKN